MLQRNFLDEKGRIWFWRREFAKEDVRATTPENLFLERDTYSLIDSDGTRDSRVDDEFTKLEGDAADLIQQLLRIVRRGETPTFGDEATWSFWRRFLYYEMKRSPIYMRQRATELGTRAKISQTVAAAALSADAVASELATRIQRDPSELDRLLGNAVVEAIAQRPSSRLEEAYAGTGLMVFRAPEKKSFVLGDISFSRAALGFASATSASGQVTFIPIASDVAVGFLDAAGQVAVRTLSSDEIRKANVAMTAQSQTIAGKSRALLTSLAQRIPFSPLSFDEGEREQARRILHGTRPEDTVEQ